MRKHSLLALALLALPLALTSCHDDDDELNITVRLNQTELSYSSDNVWSQVATNDVFQSQYVVFSHAGEIGPWGLVWSGFTPARVGSIPEADATLDNQFAVITAGGMSGEGTPYITAYWNTMENDATPLEARSCRLYYSNNPGGTHYKFRPQSVYVTNTAYSYYTMLRGSAFSEAFTAADHLTLTAHGVHEDGTESTASINLAGAGDDGTLRIIDSWELFSLSSLGEVTDIYFTMDSNMANQWGMTAPSYFALDCLSLRAKLPGK